MHSTSNLEDDYIGSGKRLWLSIRKHGRENHEREILEWFPDRDSLKAREKELVNEALIQDLMCMNIQIGGGGGFNSVEQQKNRSVLGGKATAEKLKTDPEYREKVRKRVSEKNIELHIKGKLKSPDWTGKKHKDHSKKMIGEKNSINQKGEKNSQFGTIWIFNPKENKAEKINISDLEEFIQKGFRRGRK